MLTFILQDIRKLCGVVLLAVLMGGMVNFSRQSAMPWNYQSKAERMTASVQALSDPRVAPAATATAPIAAISLAEMITAVQAQRAWVIDARPSLFFRMGHVPQAINLPREQFQAAFQEHPMLRAQPSRPVIVYCQTTECEDSQWVASGLRALGFEEVHVFVGGWRAWEASGQPVETSPAK